MKQQFSKRTRLVSALLTLAMVFTFLPFSAFAETTGDDDIAIDETNFPDEDFREYLKTATYYDKDTGTHKKINTDGNGVLSLAERTQVTRIDVSSLKVLNLKGIEHFPELRELKCENRHIPQLDLSQNTKLEILYCKNNELTKLDLSKNPKITILDCSDNKLEKLDVSHQNLECLYCSNNNLDELNVKNSENLRELTCTGNQLTKLDVDVAHKKKLEKLSCGNNKLESLIIGENRLLKELNCEHNQLPQLSLSNLEGLERLRCSENKLTTLDVSGSPLLEELRYAHNQLTSLNLEQNTKLGSWNTDAWTNYNTYTVTLTPERTFNLSTLSGGAFDVSKVITLNGGIVNGNILTVNEGVNKVTYSYRCSDNVTSVFALDVTGTGGIPGGGSTGGGSTGGGTVPPVTPPSGGGSTGVSGGSDGGAGIAVLAIGGAAVAGLVGYGVYNHVAAQKLRALLPPDVSLPENRAKTALLLWDTAGRPEPAEAPAFADVADPDTAKAAQWCVEQGLMKRRLNGRFGPDGTVPAYRILNAYRQLTGQ
ncbi:leucine-rich repeat domain-containing protein [Faecalibacterium wellingii]|uniref:Leucine-rich repeat domain-containing protein n=1 Tax=Faecalibacterium wellingii TaxID=2929491 RepID=A0ABU3TWJ7_9FIRM|nr:MULTISPECIES: hypothetical protein [Faecalibacterium]MDU8687671.1 hypothetical protein [Faecalibacterium prausnitzii]UQK57209.1 hypothetical protein MTP37_03645 [Faecalibacterium sp. HTF-F]